MKKSIGIVVGFIAVYLIFLIALAPASALMSWVVVPKHVSMHGLSGTIWQPKVEQLDIQNLSVHNIELALSPWSLMTLSPSVSATFGGGLSDGPQGMAELQVSGQSLVLTNTVVEFPAQYIVPYLKTPVPVEAFGLVLFNAQEITMDGGQCVKASGSVQWQKGALTALDENVELGNFNGTLRCENDLLTLDIDPKNVLGLSFLSQVNDEGKVSGSGYIKLGNDFPTKLKGVLSFLGKPDNQGRYRVYF